VRRLEDFSSARLLWWAMVIGMGCFVAYFTATPQALKNIGVIHYGVWYLDLYAILASNDAVRAGIDPYGPNPLDLLHRAHVYPHWWLMLTQLGLTRDDFRWLGFVLGAAFFVAVGAGLRPRSIKEVLWYLAGFCSPPVMLALERSNNDLVIFLLLAPVPWFLIARREAVRLLAIPLITAATALKTYPIVAIAVLLDGDNRRELWRRWALMGMACTVIGIDLMYDWPQFGRRVPEMRGLLSFGAADAFILMGLGVQHAKLITLAIAVVAFAILLKVDFLSRWTIARENRAAWLSFTLGAAVLTGCFFAGTSFAYRWIFALWLLPLTWRTLVDLTSPSRVRRLAIALAILSMAVFWVNGIAIALLIRFDLAFHTSPTDRSDFVVAATQPLLWAFFACLLVFLAHFVRRSLERIWKHQASFVPAYENVAT
jgi:hypothetical protein